MATVQATISVVVPKWRVRACMFAAHTAGLIPSQRARDWIASRVTPLMARWITSAATFKVN